MAKQSNKHDKKQDSASNERENDVKFAALDV